MLFKKKTEIDKPEKEDVVLKVRDVDDIPVVKEMRKQIGNNQINEAIEYGYNHIKEDYIKNFSVSQNYASNRGYILGELAVNGYNINSDEAPVNNAIIYKSLESHDETSNTDSDKNKEENSKDKTDKKRVSAIKKISIFYLQYYEPVRYGDMKVSSEPEKIVDMIKDIYNYMDIMNLFYIDKNEN